LHQSLGISNCCLPIKIISDTMADDFDTGDMFKDPEGFYPPEKEPTFAEHRMLSGQVVRVRLVGSHPLYVAIPELAHGFWH
jgi:hypothetical protein